jgi:hypothetical protein
MSLFPHDNVGSSNYVHIPGRLEKQSMICTYQYDMMPGVIDRYEMYEMYTNRMILGYEDGIFVDYMRYMLGTVYAIIAFAI